jgi:hypothetical protein
VIKQAISDMAGTNVHLYVDQKKSWAARATMIGAFVGNRSPNWDLRFVPIVHPSSFTAGKKPHQRQLSSLNPLIQLANEFINESTLKVFAIDTATVSYSDSNRTKVDFGEDLAVCMLRLWYKTGAGAETGHNGSAAVLRHLITMEQQVAIELRELAEAIDAPKPKCMEWTKSQIGGIGCLRWARKRNKVTSSTPSSQPSSAQLSLLEKGGKGEGGRGEGGGQGHDTIAAMIPVGSASTAMVPANTAMVVFGAKEAAKADKKEAAAQKRKEKEEARVAKKTKKDAAAAKKKAEKDAAAAKKKTEKDVARHKA